SCRHLSVQHHFPLSSRLRRSLVISSASLLATAFGVPGTAGAETAGSETGLEFTGVIIGTFQAVPRGKVAGESVKGEPSGALDLSLTVPAAGGAFEIEVKGGTTPRHHGVSEVLPEANGAVGESLDSDGHGRVVAWQLFYRHEVGPGSLAVGLIDPTGWLDVNDVADDEFTQFLGTSFVNNLTIDFPSATTGIAYNVGLAQGFRLTALAANATGIEPDYAQTFELGKHGNGVFGALELQWTGSNLVANLGGWVNTRHHDSDGDGIDDDRLKNAPARGVYGNLEGGLGAGQWNLRLGWADASVQPAAGFVALAYTYPIGQTVLGAGVARTFASNRIDAPHKDLTQVEAYASIPLGKGFTVSPDLQYIEHSDFDPAQHGDLVAGLRAGWSF
ncbi:MAG TPA: carbohydrate porin, partial [Nitrococcus sp.]|nr:carbohydrate porin [Nitrococcus sp.]